MYFVGNQLYIIHKYGGGKLIQIQFIFSKNFSRLTVQIESSGSKEHAKQKLSISHWN